MASPSAGRIMSSMVIQTLSTEEAGIALGVVPATIRERIRNGSLSAVKVGRGWRVHLASLNALLNGSSSPAASPASRSVVVPEHQQAAASPVQNDSEPLTLPSSPAAITPVSTVPNDLPAPSSPVVSQPPSPGLAALIPQPPADPDDGYDADDLVWVQRYRRDLADVDPQVRADAAWHLERIAARAKRIQQERTQKAIRNLSPAECREMAAAILASSPAGPGW
jgi:excisionase family DNA binding protein